jgi:hypothetical protein
MGRKGGRGENVAISFHRSPLEFPRYQVQKAPRFLEALFHFSWLVPKLHPHLAKIQSAFGFMAFHWARVGRTGRLLIVKNCDFSVGWRLGEAQGGLQYRYELVG